MSDRFVSGGTIDKPVERDDEWLKAQQDIEANRRKREEESRQDSGKTLYEVLQNNKAAKQEAFEESIKLKNQFRNLDEDEIEFLDSVLESTRAKEAAVKKETTEQLDLFRRQQEEADKALLEKPTEASEVNRVGTGGSPTGESQWAVNARKRKRVKEKEGMKGVKLRKSSTANETPAPEEDLHDPERKKSFNPGREEKGVYNQQAKPTADVVDSNLKSSPTQHKGDTSIQNNHAALGLGGYSSEEEE